MKDNEVFFEELLFEAIGDVNPAFLPESKEERAKESSPVRSGKTKPIRLSAMIAVAVVLTLMTTAVAAVMITAKFRADTNLPNTTTNMGKRELFDVWLEGWEGDFIQLPEEKMETLVGMFNRSRQMTELLRESAIPARTYVADGMVHIIPQSEDSVKVYIDKDGNIYDLRTPEEREASGESMTFGNWQDAAAWLDCGLLTSDYQHDTEVQIFYSTGHLENISAIMLNGVTTVDGTTCVIDPYIPLTAETVKEYRGGRGTYWEDARTEEPEEWISEQGYDVLLVSFKNDPQVWTASAYFMHGGIIYQIDVSHESLDIAYEKVKEIVNGMH